MDYFGYLSIRLSQIEKYLTAGNPDRKYVLGRLLEVESLAFSFRNESLITVRSFDQFDLQCETLRRRFRLLGSVVDWKNDKPYNGRFLFAESPAVKAMQAQLKKSCEE